MRTDRVSAFLAMQLIDGWIGRPVHYSQSPFNSLKCVPGFLTAAGAGAAALGAALGGADLAAGAAAGLLPPPPKKEAKGLLLPLLLLLGAAGLGATLVAAAAGGGLGAVLCGCIYVFETNSSM